ncbi:MAG: DUF3795 domain-containing protein [Promethearchaeota archaeon]
MENIAKCGHDCINCAWSIDSRKKISTKQALKLFNKKCVTYMGTELTIAPCPGCQSQYDELPKNSKVSFNIKSCLIRKCVTYNNIQNCAYCSKYPCDQLTKQKMISYADFKNRYKNNENIKQDFNQFIKPFHRITILNKILRNIPQDEIKKPKSVSKVGILSDFFDNGINQETKLHLMNDIGFLNVLNDSNFGIQDMNTYAGYYDFLAIRRNVMQFLWILLHFGKVQRIKKDSDMILTISAGLFLEKRKMFKNSFHLTYKSNLVDYIEILQKMGLDVRFEQLIDESKYITQSGMLRNKGWFIQINKNDMMKNQNEINSLQDFVRNLKVTNL